MNSIDTVFDYTDRRGVTRGCRILDQKDCPMMNVKTGEEFTGVKLKLKPIDGGRAFWSCGMRPVTT